MTLEELEKQEKPIMDKISELHEQLKDIERQKQEMIYNKNKEFLDFLRDNKEVILKLIKHTRGTCKSHSNAFTYDHDGNEDVDCPRCALEKILEEDWNDEWKVDFSVNIYHI